MEQQTDFREQMRQIFKRIRPLMPQYNKKEFWMIKRLYEYIEYYAYENHMQNTAIALPLARALHNGVYRKSKMYKNGEAFRLPYYYHCLMVTRLLADLQLPIPPEEEDILLAASLCHDTIEDVSFANGGRELYEVYGLDKRVYDIVKTVSKRADFTDEEHHAYFNAIQQDPYALLIKLSDRSNNVEDLYNMSFSKVREYVGETRDCFFPMVEYGRMHHPDFVPCIEFLYEKINALTLVTEVLITRYEKKEAELEAQALALTEENEKLRLKLREFMQ